MKTKYYHPFTFFDSVMVGTRAIMSELPKFSWWQGKILSCCYVSITLCNPQKIIFIVILSFEVALVSSPIL